MRGGKRANAGRPPGSKKDSRLIQRHCRFNEEEIWLVESAAREEGKAVSRYISDSAVHKAKKIMEA